MKAYQDAWRAGQAAFRIESEALLTAAKSVDETAFMRAVDMLAKAERIAASGCGHSGICCQHFAHLMCCIERPARFISPAEAVHGAMGYLTQGDVMLLASRGGKTNELLPMMDICRKKGVTTIVATENLSSALAQDADIVLRTLITREADRWNSQGTTSFVVLAALFDALQAALIEVTSYKNEQFALIHPSGAVGERLHAAHERRPRDADTENPPPLL